MLLPPFVNEARHLVMREPLVPGCYRIEQCLDVDDGPDGVLASRRRVRGIDRDEATVFGRSFRQSAIVYCRGARPELTRRRLHL